MTVRNCLCYLDNYRVPDNASFAGDAPPHTFNPSAEVVVEIVSPGDESQGHVKIAVCNVTI